MMRVAIVGSRGYPNGEKRVHQWLEDYLWLPDAAHATTIVSGGCPNSPDQWAEEWCDRWNINKDIYLADWSKGRSAGLLRNQTIVDNADYVVAFWNGVSRGTKNTIDLTLKAKKHLEVIFPDAAK